MFSVAPERPSALAKSVAVQQAVRVGVPRLDGGIGSAAGWAGFGPDVPGRRSRARSGHVAALTFSLNRIELRPHVITKSLPRTMPFPPWILRAKTSGGLVLHDGHVGIGAGNPGMSENDPSRARSMRT